MAVDFDTTTEGMAVFVPGAQQFGTIVEVKFLGRRRNEVVVLLENGNEVTYKKRTWFAVHPHEAPGKAVKRADAAVGKLHQPAPKPKKPQTRMPFSIDRRRRSTPRQDVQEIVEAGTDVQKDSSWETTLPKLPGPPVPRPKAGVWSSELG